MSEIKKRVISLNVKRNEEPVSAYLGCVSQNAYSMLENNIESILESNKLRYFSSLRFEKRKKDYLTGRYMAKSVVAEYLHETNLAAIEIANGVFNQPFVKYNGPDIPGVSLSHSYDWSVALSFPYGHPMGIDIEKVDLEELDIIKGQLTEDEIRLIHESGIKEEITYFQTWTMKEALSKVLKCGLTTPFTVLEIDKPHFQSNGVATCLFKNFGQYKCHSWIIKGYALSIVLPKNSEMKMDIRSLFP
ncbi:MAG: 4'-phosphopantetheinyl transferase superfamily protein [Spirochaetota bacterium]|nr:4'-phosphopantetheinyl transferase superfamily protein [Spirochaetota bacterium]